MDVFLDHQPFETDASDLSRILDQARGTLEPKGRIVVEVRFDDQVADNDTLERAHENLPDANEIHLISAIPADLCIQALEETHTCLDQVLELNKQVSDLIHDDQAANAMQRIGQSLQQWRHIITAVTRSAAMLQINLESVSTPNESAAHLIQTMAEQLRQTQQHLIDQDHIGLADTLQYEWDQTTTEWHTLIDTLIQMAQSSR